MAKKKKSVLTKLKEASSAKIKTIEDVHEQNRLKMIDSVLDTPCIPISFKQLFDSLGHHVKIMKDGKKIDTKKLSKLEFEYKHGFTPRFFINLALNEPRLKGQIVAQANINSILAKAWHAFIIDPGTPELDEFRATCELKFNDMQKIMEQFEKQQEVK